MSSSVLRHDRVHEYLLLFLVFLFPVFQKALPPITILLTLNALVHYFRFGNGADLTSREKNYLLLFIGLFGVYSVGMLYTESLGEGFFDLQVKLSLLVFPLILLIMPKPGKAFFDRVLTAFVLGCIGACILGGINDIMMVRNSEEWIHQDLYGGNFAFGIHRGYLGMYLVVGIFSAIYSGIKRIKEKAVWHGSLFLLGSLVLIGGLFMTASRAGIVALLLGAPVFILRTNLLSRSFKVVGSALFILLVVGMITLFPRNYERFRYAIENNFTAEVDKNAPGSLGVRVLVWPIGLDLFLDHFVTGVGTGDVQNELQKKYLKENQPYLYERNVNTHDQFLQTGVAIGVPGLFILLVIIFTSFMRGWKGSTLLFILTLSIFVMALFESILEKQAGVMFFALFLPLMYLHSSRDLGDKAKRQVQD